jgi:D-glycero-D-manno-heptose 1,7-bisphosphate phosphatase
MKQAAVFLDRDGVVNTASVRGGQPYPPASLAELHIPADVPAALAALRAAGLRLIVVTNQPDVARGTTTRPAVEQIHAALRACLPLDAIYACFHDDADACGCRKPQPGMLIQAAAEHSLDLAASFMVGDRWKDIVAGQRAGCLTVLLGDAYGEQQRCRPDHTAADLSGAARHILALHHARHQAENSP